MPVDSIVCNITYPNFTASTSPVAVFSFTQSVYSVGEGDGQAVASVELRSGELTFDIEVTVETSDGTATCK